ncbi:MAG: hypothetical protein RMK65_08325 [Anaerolineae bacterium]|nr:hypothetical protein [Anaerolineae bacterium]
MKRTIRSAHPAAGGPDRDRRRFGCPGPGPWERWREYELLGLPPTAQSEHSLRRRDGDRFLHAVPWRPPGRDVGR